MDNTAFLLRALIESHLAAAKTLETALKELERQRQAAREEQPQGEHLQSAHEARRSLYLDANQAAELLHVAKSTLDKLRCVGGGPPFRKFGRTIRYDVRELEAWAAAHQRFTSTSQADSLCTLNEAAEIIRVSRSKLYVMIAAGNLNVVKIGKSTRIRRSALDRLIGLDK